MEIDVHQYWPFAVLCLALALVVLRLLLREQVTLQGSMSYTAFLALFAAAALFPRLSARVAHAMGFTLLANFLFCLGIMALALLHLRALITISRNETRTIQLIQELAMLEEKLGRTPEAR